jgi:Thioesterase-like superfamily
MVVIMYFADQVASHSFEYQGYVLSLILEAGMQYQARIHPKHPDPLHITAYYLQRNDIAGCEIRIKRVKIGRSFTNLTAELVQKV